MFPFDGDKYIAPTPHADFPNTLPDDFPAAIVSETENLKTNPVKMPYPQAIPLRSFDPSATPPAAKLSFTNPRSAKNHAVEKRPSVEQPDTRHGKTPAVKRIVRRRFSLWNWLCVILITGVVSLIVLPNFISLCACGGSYDASAQSAGRNAKLAQDRFYNLRIDMGGGYASNLDSLLKVDKNLADDPSVTFIFGAATADGYSFTTQHVNSTNTFVFTN